MVIHVGANPKQGLIRIYDTVIHHTKEILINRVPNENENKIDNFFCGIMEVINSPLGCFCILLDGYVKKKTRKRYLKAAKRYGFDKAEIISIGKAELIEMIKNVSIVYETQENKYYLIFHIFENWITCAIWRYDKDSGFSFNRVEEHPKNSDSTLEDIKIFKQNLQKKYGICQNIGFYDYKKELSIDLLRLIFPEVENIFFCLPKPWMSSTLLYACHLGGIFEYSKYKSNEILEKKVTVKANGIEIFVISKFVPLPLMEETMLDKKELKFNTKIIFDIYDFEELVESFILHSVPEKIKVVLKIDNNVISYFHAFNDNEELELMERNVDELYFRIPGRASYFDSNLMAVGIDFGTSWCCAAVNRQNRIDTVALENTGSRMLPTYVIFDEKNEKFGEIAIDRMAESSQYTVFDIKRILGNEFDEINIDSMWPFKLKNINDKLFVEVQTFEGRKMFKPEEIASFLFKHIKFKIDEYQGQQLVEAVITIPASYNDTQKQSIILAANLAGWKIVYLLPEPIAATFAYCDMEALKINLNLLVFDLGGGSLDIFFVKTAPCMLNVQSFDGSLFLGGRDFDTILIKYFDDILNNKYGIKIMENESKKYKFMAECQEIKCNLSYNDELMLYVDNYNCYIDDVISITRKKFEELSLNLLQKIERITQRAVDKAKMKNDEIDVVLYVGGGSKMPMIKELLKTKFPKAKHCCTSNPDEMVAVGAALYACLLKCKYP